MTKTIRITVDDDTHKEWLEVKSERTWEEVLKMGLQTIKEGCVK